MNSHEENKATLRKLALAGNAHALDALILLAKIEQVGEIAHTLGQPIELQPTQRKPETNQ